VNNGENNGMSHKKTKKMVCGLHSLFDANWGVAKAQSIPEYILISSQMCTIHFMCPTILNVVVERLAFHSYFVFQRSRNRFSARMPTMVRFP